ncbi:MAG TPA: AtpZ/AtpI family protein [Acidimicrobiales bacterium]
MQTNRDSRDKRDLYHGFSESFGHAVELACTPVLFGGAGWWLDHRLGIFPVLTIALVVLCLVGMFARMYYAYEARMQAHDTEAVWGRPGATGRGPV